MNHYETLGISKNASDDEIKQSYRTLAKQHHPDKGGNKEKFQQIQEAYDVLSDTQKRNEYDNPAPDLNSFFSGNGGGFPFGDGFPFGGGGGFPFGGGFGNQPKKSDDIFHTCNISLQEVYTGVKKSFNLKHDITCNSCKSICRACNGKCNIIQQIHIGPIVQIINQPCQNCNATGFQKSKNECSNCDSRGFNVEKQLVEINIPKGVEEGKKYTFRKNNKNSSGNFVITIHINDHEIFKRRNNNLVCELKLTLKESIIGKELTIDYFEEIIKINTKIFGIINPSNEYIIYNKGLENINGIKGNMIFKFAISYPIKQVFDQEQIIILNAAFDNSKIL